MSKLNLTEHKQWLVDFYKQRNWYQYSPFIRLNYLNEETGEVCRAVRSLEIGRDHPGEQEKPKQEDLANLKEELADTLDQVLILADKYGIEPAELLQQSEHKIKQRFHLN